jgi:hypothetical protein
MHLATDRPAYRVVFEFWLKIFGVAFGLGVVSGIVMAFQFGTNWDVLVGQNLRRLTKLVVRLSPAACTRKVELHLIRPSRFAPVSLKALTPGGGD